MKHNVMDHAENFTKSYEIQKTWHFQPDQSADLQENVTTLNVPMLFAKASTLTYLINAHVRLFIFRKKSGLCDLIRYCALINFGKIFHPVRLLDTVRLLFLTNILPCAGFLNYVRFMGSNFGQYLREVFVCTIIFYRNVAFWYYSLFILLSCVL